MHTHEHTTGTGTGTVKVAGLTEGTQTQKEVQRASAMLALRTRFQAAATTAAAAQETSRATSRGARRGEAPKAGRWPSRMRLDDIAVAA